MQLVIFGMVQQRVRSPGLAAHLQESKRKAAETGQGMAQPNLCGPFWAGVSQVGSAATICVGASTSKEESGRRRCRRRRPRLCLTDSIYRKSSCRPRQSEVNRANPFPWTRVMGAEWVHDVVLGSSQSPEDQKPLENKYRRRDLNPHVLSDNGF